MKNKAKIIAFLLCILIIFIVFLLMIYNNFNKTTNNEISQKENLTLIEMFKNAQQDKCTNEDGTCNNKKHLHIGDCIEYNYIASEDTGREEKYSYTSLSTSNGYEDQLYSINNDTEKLNWIVLGLSDDNNHLLITTDSPIRNESTNIPEDDVPFFKLDGFNGYINAIDELNNISKIYGNGDNAESARSININDLNKLVGYNPDTENWEKGNLYEYNNKITINGIENGKYEYNAINGLRGTLLTTHDKGFYYIDNKQEKTITISDTQTQVDLKCTKYSYKAQNLIDKNSRVYRKFFDTLARRYWVADSAFSLGTYSGMYGIYYVSNGAVDIDGFVATTGQKFGNTKNNWGYGIRPVVILKSEVTNSDLSIIQDQELNNNWKTIYK